MKIADVLALKGNSIETTAPLRKPKPAPPPKPAKENARGARETEIKWRRGAVAVWVLGSLFGWALIFLALAALAR